MVSMVEKNGGGFRMKIFGINGSLVEYTIHKHVDIYIK
jgi:hypothetical protein